MKSWYSFYFYYEENLHKSYQVSEWLYFPLWNMPSLIWEFTDTSNCIIAKTKKNTHTFKENEPLAGKSEMHIQLMQLVNIIS
jgi:hypothetical protein